MSQITRNAPFGTDDTPDMQVKIVGGKRVQFAVDKLKKNESEKKYYNHNNPRPGPHGTPSILTQPNWEAYDTPTPRFSTSDQHNLARKVSSYTSPNGDRSYSFKHGAPILNSKVVLPPIASKSADPQAIRQAKSPPSNSVITSTTLEEQIGQQLRNYSMQKLKNMYIDLTTFDRQLTGMVGEAQFSVVALRHDLPLKLSLLKIVFGKFVDVRDPSMINYEKILQYFSDSISSGDEKSTTVTTPHKSNLRSFTDAPSKPSHSNWASENSHYHVSRASKLKDTDTYATSVNAHSSPLRQEEEDKLVELILAQLAPDEMLELTDLKKSLEGLDRARTNDVPIHAIQAACVKHRLPLTMSLILKLLQRAKTEGGKANWKHFLEPLMRANRITQGNNSVSSSTIKDEVAENKNIFSDVAKQPSPVSKSIQVPAMSRIETRSSAPHWDQKRSDRIGMSAVSQSSAVNSKFSFHSIPPSPPSTTSSVEREIAQLPDGWDEREPLEDEPFTSPRKTEPWSHKFNKLSHALHTYNPLSKDVLTRDEAERITKNYNLIYELGFSEKRIENAVKQAALQETDTSATKEISVNALLELLEGKRRYMP